MEESAQCAVRDSLLFLNKRTRAVHHAVLAVTLVYDQWNDLARKRAHGKVYLDS